MPDRSISIQLLSLDDAALLDNVHADVFDEPVHPGRLRAYLADPATHLLVAIRDGLVIAQVAAVIHRHPDKVTELYIDEVGVAEPWRRQGLAREMLRRMFEHGKALGCEEAWVGTEIDNVPARRLYKGFKGEPAEDFVMYVYDLTDSGG
jgi:ribosomal protein S18 acetylase RimI-like enzyme